MLWDKAGVRPLKWLLCVFPASARAFREWKPLREGAAKHE